ncbi:helix-turn-helix domain-containing protein [Salmonella enterica subsp. enterica serovar Morehead]|nr:helix-turn-helix transcriptional regulator [Salmonella enterica subsp. enterica serovar Java]EEM2536259.1 helix-turn-helix domain-containing protein [Salmonella enterica subsp. enterica serovar Morehead]
MDESTYANRYTEDEMGGTLFRQEEQIMQNKICRYMLQWIDENIDTGLNISDMSKMTGYSRRTLEFWFRKYYNMSPGHYLFLRKMTRAAFMLKLTIIPITEIAQLLHHSSNQSFAKAFKRFSGVTPTEYRNSKLWDLTILQSSILFSDEKITDVKVCVLKERYLTGKSSFCLDSYLNFAKSKFLEILKKEVITLMVSKKGDVCLSARPVMLNDLSKNREGYVGVLMTIGILADAKTEETILMPSGRFCRYHFCCDWSEYPFYTNMCFIKLMSENKFHFSGGDCYVHFFSIPEGITDWIECELFIPIG